MPTENQRCARLGGHPSHQPLCGRAENIIGSLIEVRSSKHEPLDMSWLCIAPFLVSPFGGMANDRSVLTKAHSWKAVSKWRDKRRSARVRVVICTFSA